MRAGSVSLESVDLLTDVADPVPGEGEVLVRTVLAGICGSDVHALHGRHPFIAMPYRPGHEVVGVVEHCGPEVEGFPIGQRVVVEPDLPCWHCKMCLSGRENLCENLQFFGCGWPQGALADRFVVSARRLHAVPDALSDEAAALIEPLASPVHAAALAGGPTGLQGKAIVILGAGTLGLMLVRVLRSYGARRVVITNRGKPKRDRARALGADAAFDGADPALVESIRADLGESADVVFDCVTTEASTRQAIELAGKGGTIVVLGVPAGEISFPLQLIQDRQLRLQGSATYLPVDFEQSIALLVDGVVDPADIVTATVGLDELARGFELAQSPDQVKVLVRP